MPTTTVAVRSISVIDTIKTKPGNKVTWDASGDEPKHLISIWVPDKRVFGRRLVADEQPLPFSEDIDPNVPQGTLETPAVYEYVYFDHTTGQFGIGNSHPKIEIPGP